MVVDAIVTKKIPRKNSERVGCWTDKKKSVFVIRAAVCVMCSICVMSSLYYGKELAHSRCNKVTTAKRFPQTAGDSVASSLSDSRHGSQPVKEGTEKFSAPP